MSVCVRCVMCVRYISVCQICKCVSDISVCVRCISVCQMCQCMLDVSVCHRYQCVSNDQCVCVCLRYAIIIATAVVPLRARYGSKTVRVCTYI